MPPWNDAVARLIAAGEAMEPELRSRAMTAMADLLEQFAPPDIDFDDDSRRPDASGVPTSEDVQTVVNRLRELAQPASASGSEKTS